MKKIGLFLGAVPSTGGMFQYNQVMLEAVNAIQNDRHSIVVAYTSKLWTDYLESKRFKTLYVHRGLWVRALWRICEAMDFSVAACRTICPFFDPVAKALIKEQCDLWIFPTQDHYSFQIPVPALATIHDLMHRYESKFPEVSAHGIYRMRERGSRNTCYWARGILVDSEVGKHQVIESYGLPEGRIHVLPYIAPKYIYSQKVPEGFDERYNLPGKFIFYPAQFWEHKNHKRLIRAVSHLRQQIPDLKLVLVGSMKNGYESALKLIQNLNLKDDIIILGYVPDADMPEFYRRARALVMPTFFGPTNIPPLEAFVAGCPVSISRKYGIPDQVGNAALLFDPESVAEIADCIKQLWLDDDLCSELIKNGKLKAEAWGQKQFNKRVNNIIEQILD